MFDKNTIERMAVTKLETYINRPYTNLQSKIPVGDKDISFDGSITVYNTHNLNKDTYLGEVPVQIKGKMVKKLSTKKVNYQVSKKDLLNYQKKNGAIFFVVEMTEENEFSVFYNMLLPLDLNSIIKSIEYKKTNSKSLVFKKINQEHLQTICKRFLVEQSKQPLNFKKDITDIKFTNKTILSLPNINIVSRNVEDFLDSTLGSSMYVYEREGDMTFPVFQGTIEEFATEGFDLITINEELVEYKYRVEYREKVNELIIEDIFFLQFYIDKKKATFKISEPVSVESQLKVIALLKKLKVEGSIEFLGGLMEFSKPKTEIFDNLEMLEAKFLSIKDIYLKLGIPLNFKFKKGDSVSKIVDSLQMMFNTHGDYNLNLDESVNITSSYIPLNFNIHDSFSVLVLCKKLPRDGYEYKSLFNEENLKRILVSSSENITDSKISFFTTFDPMQIFNYANFNFDTVMLSFDKSCHVYNEHTAGITNSFALKCLSVFDQTRDDRYLKLTDFIYGQIYETQKDDYLKLNFYQTLLRRDNTLNKLYIDEIIEIKQRSFKNGENLILLACNILLNAKQEAEYYYNTLTEEEKKDFLEFPISNLYHKLKKQF